LAPAEERYPKPEFGTPSPSGFLYAGISVAPPHIPVVQRSAERDDALEHCRTLARRLADDSAVVRARVFETVLMPPLKGLPRFDVLVLVETSSPEAIAGVRASEQFQKIGADLVIPADNPVRIGDTENPADGTYLFNHFTAADGDAALGVWKGLTGWYTSKVGVDNSTPLRALDDSPFPFINYARLPAGAVPFVLNQVLRPSFHRFVRTRLKADQMRALPLMCRPL